MRSGTTAQTGAWRASKIPACHVAYRQSNTLGKGLGDGSLQMVQALFAADEGAKVAGAKPQIHVLR